MLFVLPPVKPRVQTNVIDDQVSETPPQPCGLDFVTKGSPRIMGRGAGHCPLEIPAVLLALHELPYIQY